MYCGLQVTSSYAVKRGCQGPSAHCAANAYNQYVLPLTVGLYYNITYRPAEDPKVWVKPLFTKKPIYHTISNCL